MRVIKPPTSSFFFNKKIINFFFIASMKVTMDAMALAFWIERIAFLLILYQYIDLWLTTILLLIISNLIYFMCFSEFCHVKIHWQGNPENPSPNPSVSLVLYLNHTHFFCLKFVSLCISRIYIN